MCLGPLRHKIRRNQAVLQRSCEAAKPLVRSSAVAVQRRQLLSQHGAVCRPAACLRRHSACGCAAQLVPHIGRGYRAASAVRQARRWQWRRHQSPRCTPRRLLGTPLRGCTVAGYAGFGWAGGGGGGCNDMRRWHLLRVLMLQISSALPLLKASSPSSFRRLKGLLSVVTILAAAPFFTPALCCQ